MRYIVFLYRTETFTGEVRSSEEGEALWLPFSELKNQPLPRGFADMVPVFLSDGMEEMFYAPDMGLEIKK